MTIVLLKRQRVKKFEGRIARAAKPCTLVKFVHLPVGTPHSSVVEKVQVRVTTSTLSCLRTGEGARNRTQPSTRQENSPKQAAGQRQQRRAPRALPAAAHTHAS